MQDVAGDGYAHALEVRTDGPVAGQFGPVAAHGEGVKERLRGVFVGAVAGVDHGGVDPVGRGEPVGCAGGPVTDHDGVSAHCCQRLGGVLEGFALGDGRALRGEVDDVRGQPFGGRFEGDPRAGGILEEEVHHGAPAKGRELL